MNELMQSGAPGAVVAVARDGKIIFEKAVGISNLNTQVPVYNSTVFQVASITKILTAAALLTACEKKSIDIHTPIGTIIKELSPRMGSITIHQLLSHSAGLMDYWQNPIDCRDNALEYFATTQDKAFFIEPGKVFSYSNNSYALAGLVLATLNQTTYAKAIDDLLLKPLEMTSSTFELREAATNFLSMGHEDSLVVTPGPQNITSFPAGGLLSNTRDLVRLSTCLMNNGNIDGKQIISQRTIQQMSEKYFPFGGQYQYLGYPGAHYGYGLINFSYKGRQFIGHCGESGTQSSLLVMSPEYKTAVIVISNTGYYPFISTVEKALDIFLPATETEQIAETNTSKPTDIVGIYYSANYKGNKDEWIAVALSDKKLRIRFPDHKDYALNPIGPYRYNFTDPEFKFPLEICFFPDEKGKVKYLNYFWRARVKE